MNLSLETEWVSVLSRELTACVSAFIDPRSDIAVSLCPTTAWGKGCIFGDLQVLSWLGATKPIYFCPLKQWIILAPCTNRDTNYHLPLLLVGEGIKMRLLYSIFWKSNSVLCHHSRDPPGCSWSVRKLNFVLGFLSNPSHASFLHHMGMLLFSRRSWVFSTKGKEHAIPLVMLVYETVFTHIGHHLSRAYDMQDSAPSTINGNDFSFSRQAELFG